MAQWACSPGWSSRFNSVGVRFAAVRMSGPVPLPRLSLGGVHFWCCVLARLRALRSGHAKHARSCHFGAVVAMGTLIPPAAGIRRRGRGHAMAVGLQGPRGVGSADGRRNTVRARDPACWIAARFSRASASEKHGHDRTLDFGCLLEEYSVVTKVYGRYSSTCPLVGPEPGMGIWSAVAGYRSGPHSSNR